MENKTGAGGMIATRDVLAQPRDGYNLLLCTHFEAINAAVYRNPQFTLDDLAPISLVSKYFYGVAVTNALNTPDWDSFLASCRSQSRQGIVCQYRRRFGAGDFRANSRS